MDYSKIRLNNERNSHVTKRLNRLNTWKFFRVLYRDNMWRLFAFSILMLLCVAPIFGVQIWAQMSQTTFRQKLPTLNGLGFSTGVWADVTQYYSNSIAAQNIIFGLITVGASVLLFLTFSGGFGVIRDAFWTGSLSKVGVFKSLGKGIAANWAYALISVIISAFGIFGIFTFYPWATTVMPVWLAIILTVLLAIAMLLVVCYLCILCSVSVTYKQSVYENMDDSWRLMWLNFLPNIIHLLLALIPVALYFVFSGGILQSIYMVLMLMFGGMFFPLVWHSHMMRTFALFHPVEKKKKSTPTETTAEPQQQQTQQQPQQQQSRRNKKSNQNANETAVEGVEKQDVVEDADQNDLLEEDSTDIYATDEDPYNNGDNAVVDSVQDGEIADSNITDEDNK